MAVPRPQDHQREREVILLLPAPPHLCHGVANLRRRLQVLHAGDGAPAPAAPAAAAARHLPGQDLALLLLVLPLGDAAADAHDAHQLGLDDAADALDLVARVPRPQLRAGRPALRRRRRPGHRGRRGRRGPGRRRGAAVLVLLARVGRVAVRLLLPLLGHAARGVTPADDAPVALPDAGAKPPEDFAVLVAPLPDAALRNCG